MAWRVQLTVTADGSHTLYLPEIDERYHSANGAIRESKHVYIEAGLNQCLKPRIHVLEMGFGTGLNAFLTALEAEKRGVSILYAGLEKYPLPDEIVEKLNYSGGNEALFKNIHAAEWEKPVRLTPFFTLQKIAADFKDYSYPGPYDVVYYDAFAPDKQAEVWSQELFDRLFKTLNPDGILTTYCAKGQIRRRMQQAGFTVERLPGPPGKREMLRARRKRPLEQNSKHDNSVNGIMNDAMNDAIVETDNYPSLH
ncbi:MAG: tRNA (5-methylaminomethyl-2-thiouridine)(34)-methyltransferase MnmD [Dysgonamonadaceae bacterium]|jgi:tRNA U34 5-methylaminomethyl-2-thiouridine-forming methyltransferase MnmC|nr:tRNA (5-methylaminomethyl-2-thiouridine)(34)-methyltransferase MnmD [Dysgonamonadaceae bacterium]